ncbi:MAG: hypothetical protein HZB19_05030 [Chloroflexi bacterium]|nr:hypothetical protein [Chloroflexota bacterium]
MSHVQGWLTCQNKYCHVSFRKMPGSAGAAASPKWNLASARNMPAD